MCNQTKCVTGCIVAEMRKLPSYRPDISLHILKPSKEEKEVKCQTLSLVPRIDLTLPNMEAT
jgi:hypothetical protein